MKEQHKRMSNIQTSNMKTFEENKIKIVFIYDLAIVKVILN